MKGVFLIENKINKINLLFIFDKKGKKGGFCLFEPFEKKVMLINGSLKLEGFTIRKTNKKPNFILIGLPKSQKNIKPFFSFDIKKSKDLSTVGISVKNKIVYFNENFLKDLTKYEKLFVIGHELGHIFYFDEPKADLFAQYFCISKGVDIRFINYSKILKTSERVEKLIKNIKEI